MNHKSEKLSIAPEEAIGRSFQWSAPSNIALVKYWGKKSGVQIPTNPSVSLTLEHARTKALLRVLDKSKASEWISLKFGGQNMPAFLPKIEKFFNLASTYFPAIKEMSFALETTNSFPHSAGIASSASSMAAIALCLVELEETLLAKPYDKDDFFARASFLARLGSGSACRSLYPYCASWGVHVGGGSDEIASSLKPHALFLTMQDTILLVDQSEKKVSSRAGHGLMKGHLFGESRNTQAQANWVLACKWLEDGSWDMLGSLVEEEALSLHAMMMTSRPGYILMKPDSLRIIEAVREFRISTKTPLYFTLDAGPNVHLLYPESEKEKVLSFIESKILGEIPSMKILKDCVGSGPKREAMI